MPWFYGAMLALSLVACLIMHGALVAARRDRDQARQRVFRWMRLGLGLTAASYLFRIAAALHAGGPSPEALLSGMAGSVAIGLGWAENVRLQMARRSQGRCVDNLHHPGAAGRSAPGAGAARAPLSGRAFQTLRRAQEMAQAHDLPHVDTAHLLLGLLCDEDCAAVRLLDRLGVRRRDVREALQRQAACGDTPPCVAHHRSHFPAPPAQTPLTERARQVMDMAALEARRFDSETIGTEHLLLGLVLKGTGPAALVLFGRGVTVDRLREEIHRECRLQRTLSR